MAFPDDNQTSLDKLRSKIAALKKFVDYEEPVVESPKPIDYENVRNDPFRGTFYTKVEAPKPQKERVQEGHEKPYVAIGEKGLVESADPVEQVNKLLRARYEEYAPPTISEAVKQIPKRAFKAGEQDVAEAVAEAPEEGDFWRTAGHVGVDVWNALSALPSVAKTASLGIAGLAAQPFGSKWGEEKAKEASEMGQAFLTAPLTAAGRLRGAIEHPEFIRERPATVGLDLATVLWPLGKKGSFSKAPASKAKEAFKAGKYGKAAGYGAATLPAFAADVVTPGELNPAVWPAHGLTAISKQLQKTPWGARWLMNREQRQATASEQIGKALEEGEAQIPAEQALKAKMMALAEEDLGGSLTPEEARVGAGTVATDIRGLKDRAAELDAEAMSLLEAAAGEERAGRKLQAEVMRNLAAEAKALRAKAIGATKEEAGALSEQIDAMENQIRESSLASQREIRESLGDLGKLKPKLYAGGKARIGQAPIKEVSELRKRPPAAIVAIVDREGNAISEPLYLGKDAALSTEQADALYTAARQHKPSLLGEVKAQATVWPAEGMKTASAEVASKMHSQILTGVLEDLVLQDAPIETAREVLKYAAHEKKFHKLEGKWRQMKGLTEPEDVVLKQRKLKALGIQDPLKTYEVFREQLGEITADIATRLHSAKFTDALLKLAKEKDAIKEAGPKRFDPEIQALRDKIRALQEEPNPNTAMIEELEGRAKAAWEAKEAKLKEVETLKEVPEKVAGKIAKDASQDKYRAIDLRKIEPEDRVMLWNRMHPENQVERIDVHKTAFTDAQLPSRLANWLEAGIGQEPRLGWQGQFGTKLAPKILDAYNRNYIVAQLAILPTAAFSNKISNLTFGVTKALEMGLHTWPIRWLQATFDYMGPKGIADKLRGKKVEGRRPLFADMNAEVIPGLKRSQLFEELGGEMQAGLETVEAPPASVLGKVGRGIRKARQFGREEYQTGALSDLADKEALIRSMHDKNPKMSVFELVQQAEEALGAYHKLPPLPRVLSSTIKPFFNWVWWATPKVMRVFGNYVHVFNMLSAANDARMLQQAASENLDLQGMYEELPSQYQTWNFTGATPEGSRFEDPSRQAPKTEFLEAPLSMATRPGYSLLNALPLFGPLATTAGTVVSLGTKEPVHGKSGAPLFSPLDSPEGKGLAALRAVGEPLAIPSVASRALDQLPYWLHGEGAPTKRGGTTTWKEGLGSLLINAPQEVLDPSLIGGNLVKWRDALVNEIKRARSKEGKEGFDDEEGTLLNLLTPQREEISERAGEKIQDVHDRFRRFNEIVRRLKVPYPR